MDHRGITSDVRALTFDTGGTIVDWHSGISSALERVSTQRGYSEDWSAIACEWRSRSITPMLDAIAPRFNMDDVHRSVLDELILKYRLERLTAEDRHELWSAWHELPVWPDVSTGLKRLRECVTVVSFTLLPTALVIDVSRKNDLQWDCLICCEMIGVYKTQPESYRRAAGLLALKPAEIMMVACHNIDLAGARSQGFRTAFVRRPDEWGVDRPSDREPSPDCDLVVQDFVELADRFTRQ